MASRKRKPPIGAMFSADVAMGLKRRPKRRPSKQPSGPRGWMSAYNEINAHPERYKSKPKGKGKASKSTSMKMFDWNTFANTWWRR